MTLTSGLVNLTTPSKMGPMCKLKVFHPNPVDLCETPWRTWHQSLNTKHWTGKDSLVKDGTQRCDVRLPWPSLVCCTSKWCVKQIKPEDENYYLVCVWMRRPVN